MSRTTVAVLNRRRRAPSPNGPGAVPPLPPGRTVVLPGRGEVFVRQLDGPSGGPPIVLLHGWTASADLNWFRAFDRVGSLGRVLAPDHRGHGRGMRTVERFTLEAAADDVAALVREVVGRPAILVGYSMGGPIALHTAARHPDAVAGLVLCATALEFNRSPAERFQWKLMAVFEYLMRLGRPRGLVERFLRSAMERDPVLATYEHWLRGELRRGDPEMLADAGRALGSYDATAIARALQVPAAVVITSKDRLVRAGRQRALARAIPGAHVWEVRADHDAAVVEPAAFLDALEAAVRHVAARVAASHPATTPPPEVRSA